MKVRKLIYLMVAAVMAFTAYAGAAPSHGATLPSGTPPFATHIINGVSPNGTSIDLFDYWIDGQTAPDNENPDGFVNMGINEGHALLFGASMGNISDQSKPYGWWNCWTGDESPNKHIVYDKLGSDGYPKLNTLPTDNVNTLQGRNGSESLRYLFDPNVESGGKASYEDVKGLLQVDSNGYYTYDSQENYAVYYKDTNSFTLYDHPGVQAGGNNPNMNGQFFPFNKATDDPDTSNGFMNDVKSDNASLNHYFGVHMSTRFIQQNGGYVDEERTKAVTYEFSGDDDVWIFIDGVLVADLGGIHNAASVNINFATGEIKINNDPQDETLGDILGIGTGTLTDNTYHTLDFFYLERGNVDSNMKLQYNLVTIPESNLIKVDQAGDPVTGAEFNLYGAQDYAQNSESAQVIATGTTDRDGKFVFLKEENGNDVPIIISDLYNEYGGEDRKDSNGNNLILVETDTPPGYRSAGEIGLYFYKADNSEEALLLSNSVWDKGAYAMTKVTAMTGTSIDLLDVATGDEVGRTVTLVGNGAEEDPLMFAVVYQKQKDGSTWLPVSGDPINGWNVGEDSTWNSVLKAARSNPYIFQLSSSGAYQVEVSNLPGDAKEYYHLVGNVDESDYAVAYYYTEADTLDGTNENNTWRIADTGGNGEELLNRVFSMDLYVTDIKNQLYIQKVDDDNAPLAGAEFSLYEADSVTVDGEGTVTVKEGAKPYDSLKTSDEAAYMKGGGMFPTGNKDLENGEYYLIETSAPGGYKLNDTAVHIVIDNTGVYANAGASDDGVTVLRGVGSIMRSMVQFAADDDVDTTLHDIKAALATNVEYSGSTITSEPADWDDAAKVKHLQYDNGWGLLDYGLYDATVKGTVDDLTLATKEGWSKLLIRQCYKHDETVDASLKTNLGDQDITNLFSGTVTVRVANEKTGNLKISKAVTGGSAPAEAKFTFKVTVIDGKTPVSGTYKTKTGNDEGKVDLDEAGTAEVTLKASESLTILDLPEGASYTVEEVDIPAGFTPTVTVEESDGTVDGDNSAKVTGTIQHNTSDDDAVELAYTNQYMEAGTLEGATNLAITKILEGRAWNENDSFTFTLTADSSDEATVAAVTNDDVILPDGAEDGITIDKNTQDHTAHFGDITVNKAGVYKFIIEEVAPEKTGNMTYDGHSATVIVTAEDNDGTGTLNVTATCEDDRTFTNTYIPGSIKVVPRGTKVFTGRDVQDSDTFTFNIAKAEDPPKNTPMPALAPVTVSGGNFENGSADVSFGEITYNEAGTYKYVITEETGNIEGVTYDKESVLMTVKVTYDKATGEFSSDVTYKKGGETSGDGFTFTNTYKAAPVSVAGFSAQKTVTGDYQMKADDFSFMLTPSASNPKNDPVQEPRTVMNDADGSVTFFSNLEYTAPGEYNYSVSEVSGETGGIIYDDKVYNVKVDVTDDGSGQLKAEKTITLNEEVVDAITFENSYDPKEASADIQGTKKLTGNKVLEDGMFTFKLSPVGNAPMPEERTATNTAGGVFSFGTITYDKPGEYKYKVSEDKGDAAGYTYDSKAYDVTVTVTDEGGVLKAEVSKGADDIVFNNSYAPAPLDVSGKIGGTKELTGRDLKEGEFVFQLKDAEGNVVSEAKNKADGSFAFKDVTIDSAGTHNYTISEKNNGLGGVEYDGALYGVTVEATDDNGRIAVESIIYSREGELVDKAEFANTYKASGTGVQIGAIKQLEGRDLEEGEFTFVLTDENGNDVSEAVNGADGSVMFDTITYDEPGTYKYEVRELAGDDRHIRYDESVYDVTVTVKDAGKGYLEAAVDSGEGAIVFSNLYDEDEVFAKTGDNTPLAGALALALLALTGAGAVVIRRKLHA